MLIMVDLFFIKHTKTITFMPYRTGLKFAQESLLDQVDLPKARMVQAPIKMRERKVGHTYHITEH